ncbi:IPT/TIG domain-containing protein [Winogradskyella sp.]|uniref:IPT/TIG domain-containing protein n=1 Tax=Winogradskyella sp. TaxID=1883156 RepID=UPI0026219B0F|nr:IPT/TIG domain-containing protein [Winogradskyella sp.]
MKHSIKFITLLLIVFNLSCSDDNPTNNEDPTEDINDEINIVSYSPSEGYPGESVTISGDNFNLLSDDFAVFFDNFNAVITSFSSNEISIVVPKASSGNYNIKIIDDTEEIPIGNFEILDIKLLSFNTANNGQLIEYGLYSGEVNPVMQIDYNFSDTEPLTSFADINQDTIYFLDNTSSSFSINHYDIVSDNLTTNSFNFSDFDVLDNAIAPKVVALHYRTQNGKIYIIIDSDNSTNNSRVHYLFEYVPETNQIEYTSVEFFQQQIFSTLLNEPYIHTSGVFNDYKFLNLNLDSLTATDQGLHSGFPIFDLTLDINNDIRGLLLSNNDSYDLCTVELDQSFAISNISLENLTGFPFGGILFSTSNGDLVIVTNDDDSVYFNLYNVIDDQLTVTELINNTPIEGRSIFLAEVE